MAVAANTVASVRSNRWGSEDQRMIEAWDCKKLALNGSVRWARALVNQTAAK